MTTAQKTKQNTGRAVNWFQQHRFGMFIHWGLYSLRERAEWGQMTEEIPRADYEPLADRFTGRRFDARAIARLARNSGMNLATLTTKHHEGFCLFDSALTDYTSARRGARRDFVAEFTKACRAEGLAVGLYYSLMDWHHPDWQALKRGDRAGHRRFLDYTFGQLRELCTNYGKIDLLFYDIPEPYQRPEEWRAKEMNAMVRRLQPGIVINDRNRLPGDFATPEQTIQAAPKGRAWQTCMTLNENWGYSRGDTLWKSPKHVAVLLQRIACQGGSLMLNIGPKGDGSVPAQSARILGEVGEWLKKNGEAIYGALDRGVVFCAVGGHTVAGNCAYVHAQHWNAPEIGVGGIQSQVRRVVCLATGKAVRFEQSGTRLQLLGMPRRAPDPVVTVFRIEVRGRLRLRPLGVWPQSLDPEQANAVV